jgi:putative salt-induced outer membrane protein
MRIFVLVSMLTALILCPSALADQIVLKNGDRLTGSIVKSDGKSLTVRSEFVGTVNIPLQAIDQITSDQPLHLMLKDGQTVVGTVTTKEGKLEVKTAETGTVLLARESIETIRSKEAQAAYQREIDRLRNPSLLDLWNGSADVGLSLARGNSETATFNLGMNAAHTTPRDKISVYVTSLYAKNSTTGVSVTTANAKRGGLRYDMNLASRVFAFGTTDLESDDFQRLDLRVVLGGGMGWHAKKTERTTLDFFGGGSLNKEYFSTGLNRTSGEALVGEEIMHKLSSRTSLKEKLVFFPNMSETGEFRLNFDTSAVTALKSWLGWQITLSDRYLSNPVTGAKSNDVLLSTGLRLAFGK